MYNIIRKEKKIWFVTRKLLCWRSSANLLPSDSSDEGRNQRKQSHFFCTENIESAKKYVEWNLKERSKSCMWWGKRLKNYLRFWVLRVVMVVVVIRALVYMRCWNTAITGCFLGLLLVASFAKNDSESFCRCRIVHVPFTKLWQWPSFILLHHQTQREMMMMIKRDEVCVCLFLP